MPRVLLILLFGAFQIIAAEPKLHTFERLTLSTEYYSEGANFGDVSHDGVADIVWAPTGTPGPITRRSMRFIRPIRRIATGMRTIFSGSFMTSIRTVGMIFSGSGSRGPRAMCT